MEILEREERERFTPAELCHRPEHDRWMTHPDDVDYLAPADRWCRICAKPDREHVCTTCGRRADDPYRNAAAGEGCVDRVHDAFTDRRTGAVLGRLFTIYRTTPGGGLDVPVGDVATTGAAEALERFAADACIADYSLDNGSANRVFLCPFRSRHFYYAYAS